MIQTAGINCDHVPTVKRIEPPPWASGMWNARRRVKQRTEHVVESLIRAEGEGQNRQNETSEQERFFHVIISGAVFYTDVTPLGQNNFSSLNVRFLTTNI
jgi:hypothetical protein